MCAAFVLDPRPPAFPFCFLFVVQVVKYLASLDWVNITGTIENGVAPLHMACSNGNLQVRAPPPPPPPPPPTCCCDLLRCLLLWQVFCGRVGKLNQQGQLYPDWWSSSRSLFARIADRETFGRRPPHRRDATPGEWHDSPVQCLLQWTPGCPWIIVGHMVAAPPLLSHPPLCTDCQVSTVLAKGGHQPWHV